MSTTPRPALFYMALATLALLSIGLVAAAASWSNDSRHAPPLDRRTTQPPTQHDQQTHRLADSPTRLAGPDWIN